jgi:nicotinamidase-related amidase
MTDHAKYLTETDAAVLAASGYGQRSGFGSTPALVVVDVTYDFIGDRPEPITASIRRFPNSCGEAGWEALPRIRALLEDARAAGIPIFFTKDHDASDSVTRGSWTRKNARALEVNDPTLKNRIPDEIAPLPDEHVIQKGKPSAFFGTPLASYLIGAGVDSLVVAGTTTSGCVRATVVDAFSLNYRTVVAEDAVFDRFAFSHAASLFDMQAKYADVMTASEIVSRWRSGTD